MKQGEEGGKSLLNVKARIHANQNRYKLNMNKSKLKNKEKLHQSPGIDFSIGEIQGKQNKANSVAEPDKSMKNDRILPLGLQNSSSPALPLLENIIRLSCCQG